MELIFQNFLRPHVHQKALVRENRLIVREMGMGKINAKLPLLQGKQRPGKKFEVNRRDEAATAVLGTVAMQAEEVSSVASVASAMVAMVATAEQTAAAVLLQETRETGVSEVAEKANVIARAEVRLVTAVPSNSKTHRLIRA